MDELEDIVQRMIDAGESEEDIKLVIENYENTSAETDTQDFPTAVATETAPVTADVTAEDTELALVDTSLESPKNVVDPDANIESVYDNYQKYADENMPVSYNFDNPVGQFVVDKLAAFASGTTELLAGVGDFGEMLIDAPIQSGISLYNYFADDENDITQEGRNVVSGVIEQAFFMDDVLRVAADASSRLKTKRDDEDGVGILGAIKEGNYLEAVDRTLSGIFEAVPSVVAVVAGGPVGLGVIGASSTGQHYEEKSEKNPEERGLAMLGVSVVQGGVELASELVTKGIFKGVGKIAGMEGKAIAKSVLGRISAGMFFEGASEVGSEELNNVIDQTWGLNKYYDKDGNFDAQSTLTRVFDTFLISAALGGGTTVAGELSGRQKALEADRMMSPLQQKQNIEISKEISELQKLNTGVDNSQIKEKIALKKAKLLKNNAVNREIVDGFSKDEKVEYINILQNQTELQAEAKNLNLTEDQSKLNKQTQEQNISKLNSMYKTKADALAQERKAKTLQFAEDAASLGIKSTALNTEDFNKKAKEFEINNINKKLSKSKIAEKTNKINNTDYSKNSGGFFINGEFFMNKDKLIELEQLNVGAHETLHPILNALVGNADEQGKIVEKFKKELSQEQLDFMEGMIKSRYTDKETGKVDPETYNKEYLTVFSDAIADKEIKYNETLFTKIGDMLMPLFRSLGFSKLKFDSSKDVYNFMKEYSKSAEKGAISKDIKQFVAPALGVTTDFSKKEKSSFSKTTQEQVDTLQEELDNLDEYDFTDEIEYDQAVANLENKIRTVKRKETLAKREVKREVKKEVKEKVVTDKKTFDNEGLVETIKSKETTRKEKSNAETELLESFDALALKSIKYDTRKGDYDRTEIRDYLRQFLPGIIDKYKPSVNITQKMLDGKAETVLEKQDLKIFNSYKKNNPSKELKLNDNIEVKFSTWAYNNIAPKAQQTYERFRKIADKSLDVTAGELGSVKETAAEQSTSTQETVKKPSRKIKPIELIRNLGLQKKYKDSVKKIVEGGKALVDGNTFGNLKDLAAEVTAEIFDIPLLKVTDPADNLAFKDVIVDASNISKIKVYYPDAKVGMVIKSESSKIQDIIKSMGPDLFKLLPPENVAPELATVDAQAYKGVKGTGLKIPSSLMKAFYEATGKRSKGVTSQVAIKKLKPGLTYEQFLKELGIVKGQPNTYDRAIGQRLKAITTLFGKLATNTEVRQLESVTDVQAQNIAAGKSDIQFSKSISSDEKTSIKNVLNSEISNTISDISLDADVLKRINSKISEVKNIRELFEVITSETSKILGVKSQRNLDIKILQNLIAYSKNKNSKEIIDSFKEYRKLFKYEYKVIGYDFAVDKLKKSLKLSSSIEAKIKIIKDFLKFESRSIRTGQINGIKTNKTLFDKILKDTGAEKLGFGVEQVKNKSYITFKKNKTSKPVRLKGMLDITEIKKGFTSSTIETIKQESTAALDYIINILKNTDIENAKGFLALSSIDQRGILRKLSTPGFEITGLKKNDIVLEHETTVLSIHNKLVDFVDGKISEEKLREFISESKVNLISIKLDKILNSKEVVTTDKARYLGKEFKKLLNKYKEANRYKNIGSEALFSKTYEQNKKDFYSVWATEAEMQAELYEAVEKARKPNNKTLPEGFRLSGDFTNQEVLDKMKELDDQQAEAGIQFSNYQNLDKDFNDILEKKSGIASDKEYKRVKAEVLGASKGRFNFFIPPSAEDFMGLLYATLGKNKTGDAQMAWYKKNLLNPFARAMENVSRDRNSLGRDFRALKKTLKIVPKNLKKKLPGEPFTTEQAVRVWIWNQIGKDVPGLDDADVKTLVDYVNSRPDLQSFGTEIMKLNKGTAYASPTDSWNTGTITTDLLETLNTTKRKEYLELWQQNVDIIFSEKNLNKLEAIYGKQYRKAMENILTRMKTGKNRVTGSDSLTTRVTDWLTGSIGAIMFFNTRSAVLQTLSAVNFINFGDNNILAAGKAFANQKQYWTDFKKLFNSEFLIERRDGLKMNVNEADIADIAKEKGVRGVINKLLKLGFTPTQLADSFAIASGGSTFYRNRLNALIKGGMNTQAAEKQAMSDFREIAEESQQSSRPDKISQQQAGPLGRIVLAFANTPAQYARLIKKAASDLKNGRGDVKTNISKIIYYGVAQNLIFNALQQALFAISFGEDEEEDEKKVVGIANGMADSLLRGIGIGGAIISTVKNAGLKLAKENAKKNPKYEEVAIELLKISPPVASKIGKVRAAGRSYSWDKKEMKEKGWSLDNPAYLANANIISAASNIPLDRVIKKIDNITASTGANLSFMQRVALLAGWSEWQLGINKDDKKTKSKKGRTINKRVINKRVVNKRTIN